MTKITSPETGLEIAVIGMSGKFPGANTLDVFWNNLKNGVETISWFTAAELHACGVSEIMLANPNYVKAFGKLEDKGYFDSAFFGYTPKEAETLEPSARLFHECAWEALEDAGYDPIEYSGAIGLYAGASDSFDWQVLKAISRMNTPNQEQTMHMTENSLLLSTRISHKLNLMGPSITLFTACSTALVAIHTACRSLLTGECHIALAGAASVSAAKKTGYMYQEGMILSPDGHCRTFDERAGGTLYGDGVGVVVLKRLKHAQAEADNILGIIKASAVNNDGSVKASFTAPGKKRIADVMRTTLKLARLTPDAVDFIEAHGTATALGDTIEMEALKEAFAVAKKGFCGLGSVKSNFGHLDVAAGIASFIKVVLALTYRCIPPSLHFEIPNPAIDFIDSPFYVNAAPVPLEGDGPFRAGVSSFGIGGTNAFMIIEAVEPRVVTAQGAQAQLLLLSARTDTALAQMTANLAQYLKEHPHLDLGDIAYTLQVGRRAFSRRRMVICSTTAEAATVLSTMDVNRVFSSVVTGKEKAQDQCLPVENTSLPATVAELTEIGTSWLNGTRIQWQELYDRAPTPEHKPRRISLPTYPFERHYYWIETPHSAINPVAPDASVFPPPKALQDWCYIPSWERADFLPTTPTGMEIVAGSPWLLFTEAQSLGESLREYLLQYNRDVIIVRSGVNTPFTRIQDHEFVIDPAVDLQYDALFAALKQAGKIPGQIIHLWTSVEVSDSHMKQTLERGFYSLLNITKAIGTHGLAQELQLLVVTAPMEDVSGDEPFLSPQYAPLLGFIDVFPLEYPDITCGVVDMVSPPAHSPRESLYIRYLLAEMAAGFPNPRVAYRGHHRWTRVYKSLRVDPPLQPVLKHQGVYLITGGLGGIGLTLAQYLSQKIAPRLILIGRSAATTRQNYGEILAQMEKNGAQILIASANVTDEEKMRLIILQAEENFGPIDGIFHAAGIADYAGVIEKRTRPQTDEVLAAKIYGTMVLVRIFQDRPVPPRFLVLFSSLGNILYGDRAGQVGYNAANHFLDALASARMVDSGNGMFIQSINWPPWLDTGMARHSQAGKEKGGIAAPDAIEVLARVLGTSLARVIVCAEDLSAQIKKVNQPVPEVVAVAETHGFYPRPPLSTPYEEPRDNIQVALASVWQKFFGIRTIGIGDDFFELGGDSLKAITVITDIHRLLDIRVPITQLFRTPTIAGLADYITATQHEQTESPHIKTTYADIEPVEEREYYPLSSVQTRIYILQQMAQGGMGYNTPLVLELGGVLDKELLEDVFHSLLARHESLRTSFEWIAGEPVQRIHPAPQLQVEYIDLTLDQATETGDLLAREEKMISAFIRPFDLTAPTLLRVGLIRENSTKHVLMIDMHHIITDGSSIGILIREFILFYTRQTPSPLRIQYKDYASWQNSSQQRAAIQKQADFWLAQFAGEIPVLNLPTDFVRPPVQSFTGSTVLFEIGAAETAALKQIAQQENATLFMILFSLYNILLAKMCNQEDIVVGTPLAGRTHADLQQMIGMLVNTLALRNYPVPSLTFIEFLKQVQTNTLAAFDNQDYLFEDLVEQVTLKIGRDASRNPIFDTMFNLLNFGSQYEVDLNIQVPGLSLAVREFERGIAIFDLSFHGTESAEGVGFKVEYCSHLFKPETIWRFIAYFKKILATVLVSPNERIAAIEIISAAEKEQLLLHCNTITTASPIHTTIPEWFEQQVTRTPDHIALSGPQNQLSYAALNKKSTYLAHCLQEKGVLPHTIVALMLDRSIEMIIGILGILKSGAAYLPIIPDYPQDRIDYIVKDSSSKVILTHQFIQAATHLTPIIPIIPITPITPTTPAYIIYTSGTTGKPKGILLEHRTIVNLMEFQFRSTAIHFSRVLQFAAIGFDVSVQEIFSALLAGGTLCLPDHQMKSDILQLFDFIARQQVNILFWPPAFLKFVFSDPDYIRQFPASVQHIIAAGEQLVVHPLLRQFLKERGVFLHNHYGPSETHVVTTLTINPAGEIPEFPAIGTPIQNTGIYIIDQSHSLLPVGLVGELCIASIGLARGYLNNPELTGEKFTTLSFSSTRIYKTGDLARWTSEGCIQFLGRSDTQVKIRGFRIELGEIETQLLHHDAIKEALVVAKTDNNDGSGDDKYLCAYIVATRTVESAELHAFLGKELPEYMIPAYFVRLEKIPLTANGKIDRTALPLPQHTLGKSVVPPGNPIEKKLREIWSGLLRIEKEKISIHDNFFVLGGHSLKATLLVSTIHKELQVKVPLSEVFKSPTIRGLSNYMNTSGLTGSEFLAIEPVERREYYPLSSAQKRLYFLQLLDPGSISYNLPMVIPLEKCLDSQTLESALKKLLAHHESLRTAFIRVGDDTFQRVHEQVEFTLEYFDLSLDAVENKHQIEKIARDFIRPFDLSQAPLFRSGQIKMSDNQSIWLVDIHHIVADGSSQTILTEDFFTLMQGKCLAPLPIQYKDFSQWQNHLFASGRIEAQEKYWLELFAGDVSRVALPVDFERPPVFTFAGDSYYFMLERGDVQALRVLANRNGATLYMNMMALLNTLFYKYTGQTDIIIGIGTAGRRHVDLESVVGMFINTLAMRNHPAGEKSYEHFLQEVLATSVTGLENQDVQFEALVEKLDLQRDPSRNPLFDILIVVQNFRQADPKNGVEQIAILPQNAAAIELTNTTAKFDLTFFVQEQGDDVYINIEYYTGLFTAHTIQWFVSHFNRVLKAVIQDPNIRLKDISILSDAEKEQILDHFNDTRRDYPQDKSIPECFAEQVAKTPDSLALFGLSLSTGEHAPVHITYRELQNRAACVANYLFYQHHVQPDSPVGVLMDRSVEMMIAVLAILGVGGAYVPISPAYPFARIKKMVKDVGLKILLSQNDYMIILDRLMGECGDNLENYLYLDSPDVYHKEQVATNQIMERKPLNGGNLAYIIYTSGSTGIPKGVMVEHRNVLRLVKNTNFIQFKEDDKILQTGALEFDASTFEIWGVLLNGLVLVLERKETILATELLKEILTRHKITILWLTAPFFNQIVDEDVLVFARLNHLLVGGDVLSPSHINRLRSRFPRLQVTNGYGPTENTTFSTTFLIERNYLKRIPIGKPIANSTVYVLDKDGHLLPPRIPGQLYTGGDGVARGYLNSPELTHEKFITLEGLSHSPTRLYQTGDQAKWRADGVIEFLGRFDNQVKIRGYRIEMAEITNRLLTYTGVKEAVVIDLEETTGSKYLCAYVVIAEGFPLTGLKELLAKELPDYMMPAYFIPIKTIPLTTNGKVNRKALPKPETTPLDGNVYGQYVAPRNEIEKKLVAIWQDVLSRSHLDIGIDHDFFQLGGHSLKATVLVSKIHQVFQVKVPLVEIFKTPRIRQLAEYITATTKESFIAIQPVETKEYYLLSSAQKRLYFLHQLAPESTGYNMPEIIPLAPHFAIEKVEKTFALLIARHESLRTAYFTVDELPVQKIHDPIPFKIEKIGNMTDMTEHFIRPFDLSQAPLLRVGWLQQKNNALLFIDMHHIISDGVSQTILRQDFMALYQDQELLPLRIQYKDYAAWQNLAKESPGFKLQQAYWLNEFAGEIPLINLPIDYTRPAIQLFDGSSIYFAITPQATTALNEIAEQENATLFMVLLAIFNVLLFKLSHQEDIIIGTPIAGRRHADLEKLIGMFVNTLALRNFPIGEIPFREFLRQVKARAVDAFENQEFQFEDLVEKITVNRDVSRNPVFDVMFALQNMADQPEESFLEVPEPENNNSSNSDDMNQTAKFDLTLEATQLGNSLGFTFEYCTKLFKRETIARYVLYFKEIIAHILLSPEHKLQEIEFLPEAERKQILLQFNDTQQDYPPSTIHQLFAEQAERTPDHIALIGESSGAASIIQLTYAALNHKSHHLSSQLIKKGVLPNTIVGIMVERSLEMVIGIIAILKSSAAYLPIAPDCPEDRKQYMLVDSNAKILLTANLIQASTPITPIIPITPILPIIPIPPITPAYVIYTSGSTGKPKGVLISHRAVVNRLFFVSNHYQLDAHDVILQKTPYTFDVSVCELFRWILPGATLCLLPSGGENQPELILDTIAKYHVTTIDFVPSALHVFLAWMTLAHTHDKWLSLRWVFIGAEVVRPELVAAFNKIVSGRGNIQLINAYGPTEATVDVTSFNCSTHQSQSLIPIGKPMANTQIYILDSTKRILPIGLSGELYIAGECLALGYLNNPELTAATFTSWSIAATASQRIYKTGDLARWLADGNIEFLGRIDNQVKIRGFRIELGEIESSLAQYPGIKEVVVLMREDVIGEKYLCAYIVTSPDISIAPLRDYLSTQLPEYMIPPYFIPLEKIPVTQNGKIDRQALPHPELNSGNNYMAPRNETERQLVSLWSEILNIEKDSISINSSFFHLGGHSLNATLLVARIHQKLAVKVPLAEVFRTSTIRELAQYITATHKQSHSAIPPSEQKEYYLLSSAQKRLYFLHQLAPKSTGYNMPEIIPISPNLEIARLEKAFTQLIERHESLRTSFFTINESPVQIIHPHVLFKIAYAQNIEEDFITPFDLTHAPLLRVAWVKHENKHWLLVDMHHIISDGISHQILQRDFMALYEHHVLHPLPIQYKDFAEWQNKQKETPVATQQQEYWVNQLGENIPVLNLPMDYPRPTIQVFDGSSVSFAISAPETLALNDIAKHYSATLFMVLLAIFNVLLAKLSGQEDIIIGTPVAGRRHTDLEEIIGMFVNTLALRNTPCSKTAFPEFLGTVKERALDAFENQEYPFEDIVEHCHINRDVSRNPLFDVMFSLQNNDDTTDWQEETNRDEEKNQSSKFDLTLSATPLGKRFGFTFQYCTKLFKRATLERFVLYFKQIVSSVIHSPDQKIQDIQCLPIAEKEQILFQFNNTHTEYPRHKTLHHLFVEQVEQTPDHIALIGASSQPVQLSYVALNEKSNRLAFWLQEQGILPDTIVAILVERSLETIIGILAIIKAGAAYLPIDPSYPQERIDFILKDSQAHILLTDQFIQELTPVTNVTPITPVTNVTPRIPIIPIIPITPTNLAYIIYTSGSTGKPKGVLVEHSSIVNLIDYQKVLFNITPNERVLQFSTLCFDASVEQIFITLTSGAALVLIAKETLLDQTEFTTFLNQQLITHLHAVPFFLNQLNPAHFTHLKRVITGGDACSKHLAREWYKHCDFYNKYGPTETTVASVEGLIRDIDDFLPGIPIGKPMGNTQIYILDNRLLCVPIGVAGEMVIGGAGVTRGYLNQPQLTHDKFISLPTLPTASAISKKFYKTGDLTRWLPAGTIEFLGRIDQQVKIHGFRIELGEIENQLLTFPPIQEAVVLARTEQSGEKYLCAYICSASDWDAPVLREFLAKSLPDHMIPLHFIALETMPLNTSGKIDRNALPPPELKNNQPVFAPRDEIEQKLVAIWSHVLNVAENSIGIDSHFFHLGGHSLKATILTARIHKVLDVKVPLVEIFKTPRLRELADYIKGKKKEYHIAIAPTEEKEYYPLSSAQKRLYFLHQLAPQSIGYNMPEIIPLPPDIEMERLEKTFNTLLTRHESLRTSYFTVDQLPVQKIHPAVPFKIAYLAHMVADFVRPFDLAHAPLLRVAWFKSERNSLLLIDMHHIISDGVSHQILWQDFMALYQDHELPPLRIQYKDFAAWQNLTKESHASQRQRDYWLKKFAGEIPVLQLPIDYIRPVVQVFDGSAVHFALSHADTNALNNIAATHSATLFMVLLAFFNILLSKLSGQEDIIIGTPSASRRHADLEKIIGMFVNTLPLRNTPTGELRFREFLEQVKRHALDAFENQDYPFEDIVENCHVNRDASRNPLFDVMFSLQNITNPQEMQNEPIGEGQQHNSIAKFDLTLGATEFGEGLELTFEYCTQLFKPDTLARFIIYFKQILSSVFLDPGQKLQDIEFIPAAEKAQILLQWNNTHADYPTQSTIHHLFAEQVDRTPDFIAIIGATGSQLSYSELNRKSNSLAHWLQQKGALPNTIVGIKVARSIEMIIGILGILKSGNAYLPLDPLYPQERIDFILKDSGANIVLTEQFIQDAFLCTPVTHLTPINSAPLAYVIFTSGSTGYPKGVPITHANLCPLFHWGYTYLGIGSKDSVLQNISYFFDWSVWEIFITLTTGARFYLVADELLMNPDHAVPFMKEKCISVLHVTPTQYSHLIALGLKFETLKYLFLGAEKLTLTLLNRSLDSVQAECRVFNMYGPTETTIISAVFEIPRGLQNQYESLASIPIGSPVANSLLLVLDHYWHLCPVNVTGQLVIGGDGLSAGYLNNPQLTATTFIFLSTFSKTVYKTGDLCRWLPDGNLEFLGRIDHQVKIRGFRIELGEIEQQLVNHPDIKEAVVLAKTENSGDHYLCAYIISVRQWRPSELREYLSQKIPDYMIPAYFVPLDKIPVTPNGKINRNALPEPLLENNERVVAATNPIEKELVTLWAEVLGIDQAAIGMHQNFFQLGGHSLKATVIVSKIQKIFNIHFPLAELFKTPTVKALAEYIRTANQETLILPDEGVMKLNSGAVDRNNRNLFLIHDGTGEVEGYLEFCRFIDIPLNCWGLRAHRLKTGVPLELSIEDIATDYVQRILAVQAPRFAPYCIAGWSLGGTIAFEIARQLENRGEKMSFIGLIDAPGPQQDWSQEEPPFSLESELNWLLKLLNEPRLTKKIKQASTLTELWSIILNHLEDNHYSVKTIEQLIPADLFQNIPNYNLLGIRELIYSVNVMRTLTRARALYIPAKKIQTTVHYFNASLSAPAKEEWQDYCAAPIIYHEIPGDHFSIFKKPHVRQTAKIIANALS